MTDTKTPSPVFNPSLILIGGKSGTGKTASLRDLNDPRGVVHLNCDSGKELPFKDNFRKLVVTHPQQVLNAFREAQPVEKIHTIVVDTLTFLMEMYESKLVLTASEKDRRTAWSNYGQFWKELMQDCVANSTKNVIFTAHTSDMLNESEGIMETLVKVKGATMNQGIEAYFCNVVASKKLPLHKLSGYSSKFLNITPEDEMLGYKYVFQTKLTKDTVHERIRGPMGMWDINETFIDNNAQFLLDRLHEYYV